MNIERIFKDKKAVTKKELRDIFIELINLRDEAKFHRKYYYLWADRMTQYNYKFLPIWKDEADQQLKKVEKKLQYKIRSYYQLRGWTKDKRVYIQADDVRQNATAREILEQYGISIGRTGMIRCIEHDDRTPSMKVYEYNAHCFGCQRTFDTIGLIMALEPCDFKTAIRRLAN